MSVASRCWCFDCFEAIVKARYMVRDGARPYGFYRTLSGATEAAQNAADATGRIIAVIDLWTGEATTFRRMGTPTDEG